MVMEINAIQAFAAIARVGAFTRAAEELYLSQPAISRRIDLLERELGAPLFERFHGGARLTEAGHAFLPFAQQVLAAVRDGTQAVRAVEREDQGTLTLAMVGTLASTDLTGQLQRFRAAHPRVRVVLHTGRSDEVSDMVRRGEADIGLRYFADPHPALVSTCVHEEPLLVVAASQSRLTSAGVRDPKKLTGMPWVTFPVIPRSPGQAYARLLEHQLQICGLGHAETIVIDSLTAQKRFIEADFGLGLLPESSIQEELRLGTLVTLDIPALRTVAPVTIIRRRQGYLSRAARRLIDEITRQ